MNDTVGAFFLRYTKYVFIAFVVVILVVNAGFLFNRTFTPFGEYTFRSKVFQDIQNEFPILDRIPIPVPYPYLQGVDLMRHTEQSGDFSGNIYFLGKISKIKGFVGYYFVASLLKVPIATQIILILAFLLYFFRKGQRTEFLKNEFFILISVAFFTIYFNFFFNTQIGIRYYLPVFPLLYVFSGSLFVGWKGFTVVQKSLGWGLILYLFISTFSYYPYNISYFNEFVWNRTQAYKYLADSNVDWGQGKNDLWDYISKNPTAIYRPDGPHAGLLVVSVNDLVGITISPDKFAWLRKNFEPIDTIAYTYLVYDISPVELNEMCATTDYCRK